MKFPSVSLIIPLLTFTLSLHCSQDVEAQISDNGHPEHFVIGAAIGGITSYLVFKKTDDKLKSWLIGAGAATAAGLLKEAIDPLIDRKSTGEDLAFSALGGAVGACIVIPLKPKKKKEVAYLF